jgi:DNA-binding response OmpR family regulator
MRKVKLLVIDDDPNICEIVALYAENSGFTMINALDGVDGLVRFYDEQPDLVVLDLMLPEMDGWSVLREIRKTGKTPVILLTGKSESYDKIRGLELGADDYVVKPFEPQELMARVRAVLRRSLPQERDAEVIRLGELVIDKEQFAVVVRGHTFPLPPKEMEMLYFFACHPNRVFTRIQLLDQIWGFDYQGDPRTVDVHIKRIREKLRDCSAGWSIVTIRGVGYKLEGDLP